MQSSSQVVKNLFDREILPEGLITNSTSTINLINKQYIEISFNYREARIIKAFDGTIPSQTATSC